MKGVRCPRLGAGDRNTRVTCDLLHNGTFMMVLGSRRSLAVSLPWEAARRSFRLQPTSGSPFLVSLARDLEVALALAPPYPRRVPCAAGARLLERLSVVPWLWM